MEWLSNLFIGEGIAHSIFLLALVIAIGIFLGKVKVGGISLGITWILFAGIAFSHFGMRLEPNLLHFIKEFGLILFVYSIGLQVGPGFFASFKKGGITLNLLATLIVFLGVVTTYVIHLITGTNLITMVGILSGAVTNTPGLGAAQQTFTDVIGENDPTIAMGYAVAYPLGVIGIIFSIVIIRYLFGIKIKSEIESLERRSEESPNSTKKISVEVKNPAVFMKSIFEIDKLIDRPCIFSRLYTCDGNIEIPTSASVIHKGDKLLIVASAANIDTIITFLGVKIEMDQTMWENLDRDLVVRKIMITKPNINGKTLGNLKIRNQYGVNITRVNRAGVDLMASSDLQLQMGDRVLVVGDKAAIEKVSTLLGNSLFKLREPNLIPIFLGIALGVLFGSIPFMIPGIPQPVKLGLAGGPLIIAILMSRFGPKYKLVTYTTLSANMMLREVGISLFLAAVGLGAGDGFIDTILNKGGYMWIGYGVIITVLPLLITATIGRFFCKLNYFTLMGLISGSTTDPPALAYSNSIAANNQPAVAYATVYPLTMFLRVLTAQIMILFAL